MSMDDAIFNDLEQPLTQFSKSRHSLMLKSEYITNS